MTNEEIPKMKQEKFWSRKTLRQGNIIRRNLILIKKESNVGFVVNQAISEQIASQKLQIKYKKPMEINKRNRKVF